MRDNNYLEFIRTLPCLMCGDPHNIHAHHTKTGGMGIKASDYTAVPLCPHCHNEVHQHKGKKISDDEMLEFILESLQETYHKQRR